MTDDATATTPSIEQLQDELDALNANITKVGSRIRELKKSNTSNTDTTFIDELTTLIQSLQELKLQSTQKSELIQQLANNSGTNNTQLSFQRKVFDDLMIRKMYIIPSFEIHGGVKGLFDLGPPACSLKVSHIYIYIYNIIYIWYFFLYNLKISQ
jgi:glycyl-tRNA synthetase